MLSIEVIRSDNSTVISCLGHARFDEFGKDIVCSAASVLFINTINSIEKFTNSNVSVVNKKDSVFAKITDLENDSELLISSMILGLQEIEKQYGNYISFSLKED